MQATHPKICFRPTQQKTVCKIQISTVKNKIFWWDNNVIEIKDIDILVLL